MLDTGETVTSPTAHLDIHAAIADAISNIVPPGKVGAVVAVANSDGDVRFAVATKIGDHWTVEGDLARDGGGHVTGRVLVAASW